MEDAIYLYNAKTNSLKLTTYKRLESLTGIKRSTLYSYKTKRKSLPEHCGYKDCYVVSKNLDKEEKRKLHSKIEYRNETWKEYQKGLMISNYGRAKKITEEGEFFLLPYRFSKSERLGIKFKNKIFIIHKLVAELFVENPNNLECVVHKNGILTDNYHTNLEYVDRKTLGEKFGGNHKKTRPIVVYDGKGNLVDYYKNVRQASLVLPVSYCTIRDYLQNKWENPLVEGYYRFEYDE